jgi:monofunctional biosynthetic peptidoglycan transglycosylase
MKLLANLSAKTVRNLRRFLLGMAAVIVIWVPTAVVIQVMMMNSGYYMATSDGVSRYMKRPPGWVDLKQISNVTRHAFIVSEDWMFYQHAGIDYQQLGKALEEYMKKGKRPRGASTITQQLAKNVFTSKGRNIGRKLVELVYTFAIETLIEKQRILEIYLNVIEYGKDLYGIGPASQYYFKKKVSQLAPREAAFLAMLLPNPKNYSASFRRRTLSHYGRKTIFNILRKLRMAGLISSQQMLHEAARPFSWER